MSRKGLVEIMINQRDSEDERKMKRKEKDEDEKDCEMDRRGSWPRLYSINSVGPLLSDCVSFIQFAVHSVSLFIHYSHSWMGLWSVCSRQTRAKASSITLEVIDRLRVFVLPPPLKTESLGHPRKNDPRKNELFPPPRRPVGPRRIHVTGDGIQGH